MTDQNIPAYARLADQIVALKLLPRVGWLQRGIANAESVAEHSFGLAALALIFTAADDSVDRERVLAMALVHDVAEALIGDLPFSARRLIGEAVKRDAERIWRGRRRRLFGIRLSGGQERGEDRYKRRNNRQALC